MEERGSNTKPYDLLKKIRDLTRSFLEDLCNGRSPKVPLDRYRNYCTDPTGNCSGLHKGKEILSIQRESYAHRLNVLLRVLLIVQHLLQENKHGSKRDIYYMHPSVFSEQAVVDRAINDICILFRCSRHNLNVVSVGKGLVMGWLRFSEGGRKFDCMNSPNTAHPIPVHVEEVRDIVGVAKYILIVEKETVFQRLANDHFCNTNHCIIITGRGYPDVPTRRFLRLLVETLHLPAYCLVDCDPYGFDILTTYRFGSMVLRIISVEVTEYLSTVFECLTRPSNQSIQASEKAKKILKRSIKQMAYDAKFLRLPEIRWLGAFPSDSENYQLPKRCLLPLTDEDRTRAEAMLLRCYLHQEAPQWRSELKIMLKTGVKFEIEALSVSSFSFLSDTYIPSKIQLGLHI